MKISHDELRAIAGRAGSTHGYLGNDNYGNLTVPPSIIFELLDEIEEAARSGYRQGYSDRAKERDYDHSYPERSGGSVPPPGQ